VGEARRRRIHEGANPLIYSTPIGPYPDKAALAQAGFIELPSSTFTMTDISISELWDREKANLRRGFRGRQADLGPYLDLAECEAVARSGTAWIQKMARAEKQRADAKKHAEIYAPRRAEISKAYASRRAEQAAGAPPA
jgi:hypothetical protein